MAGICLFPLTLHAITRECFNLEKAIDDFVEHDYNREHDAQNLEIFNEALEFLKKNHLGSNNYFKQTPPSWEESNPLVDRTLDIILDNLELIVAQDVRVKGTTASTREVLDAFLIREKRRQVLMRKATNQVIKALECKLLQLKKEPIAS